MQISEEVFFEKKISGGDFFGNVKNVFLRYFGGVWRQKPPKPGKTRVEITNLATRKHSDVALIVFKRKTLLADNKISTNQRRIKSRVRGLYTTFTLSP